MSIIIDRTTMGHAAAALARGWHVLPVEPGGKRPITRLAPRGVTDATDDLTTVTKWLDRTDRNYGIAAGASGLVILDEDQAGALDQWAAHRALTLPATFTVATAHGRHLYYSSTETFTASTQLDGYGIDVRSGSTYVVGPGSVHASGVIYQVADRRPVTALPEAVAAVLRAPRHTIVPQVPSASTGPVRAPWLRAAVNGVAADLHALRTVPEGQAPHWDTAVFAYACRLVRLANSDPAELPISEAARIFFEAAPTDNTFTDRALTRKWQAAVRLVGSDTTGPKEQA